MDCSFCNDDMPEGHIIPCKLCGEKAHIKGGFVSCEACGKMSGVVPETTTKKRVIPASKYGLNPGEQLETPVVTEPKEVAEIALSE